MSEKYLLSIDGGGLRGIIPAVVLAHLESITERTARDIFSFIAGTSTGAIIAAALAAGVPASQIVEMYVSRAPAIFSGNVILNTLRRIFSGYMYSTERLHDMISSEIGSARDWTLNDSPVDLLVTSTEVPSGKSWYFVKDNPENRGCTGQLGLVDCVTASSSAPTYFRPWTVPDYPGRPIECRPVGRLVDGGVGVAGNPVYQACVEAFYYSEGYRPEETTVVSLGIGRFLNKQMPTWILPWVQWTMGDLLESPEEQQTELVCRHFPETPFYRIDKILEEDIALDDDKSVSKLWGIGEQLAELVDWQAILDGTDERFRVRPGQTSFLQYAQPPG